MAGAVGDSFGAGADSGEDAPVLERGDAAFDQAADGAVGAVGGTSAWGELVFVAAVGQVDAFAGADVAAVGDQLQAGPSAGVEDVVGAGGGEVVDRAGKFIGDPGEPPVGIGQHLRGDAVVVDLTL